MKTGSTLKCLNCGTDVYVPKNRLNTFKFCSRSCGANYVRIRHNKDCEVCGKNFEHISSRASKAKYCSRTCYYKAMSKKGSVSVKCKHCGVVFKTSPSKNRVYCSKECVNKSELSVWNPSFSVVRKAMVSRGMLTKCSSCGYDEHPQILGVHHIDKNRKNNNLSNLIVLCPNCHSIAHSKHIAH